MENPIKDVCFTAERARTDSSLIAERERTNASLLKARGRAEKISDNQTEVDRVEADELTSASRSKFDTDSKNARDATNYISPHGQNRADAQLLAERVRSDRAIETERAAVDAAIALERESKKLLAEQLLIRERQLTDTNLNDERIKTDTEFSHAALKLSSEITDHVKTKSSLTTRDEFLAIASHDLRNPLGAVSGCADMMLGDEDLKLSEDARHWIGFMKRNSDKALRLIADLLDVERIAIGKFELNITATPVLSVFDGAIESVMMAANAKGVRVSISKIDHEVVMMDGERIQQVLVNLLGNAIKFTPAEGQITLSSEVFDGEIEMTVADTGSGIATEKFHEIFERLTQLKSKDRTGLGLGLYIAQTIVQEHGGVIAVESTVGVGSRFSFRLPKS